MDGRRTFGVDVRRTMLSPVDQARAEGLVARYGGMLEVTTGLKGELVVQWTDPEGCKIVAQGPDAMQVIDAISRRMESGAVRFTH